MSRVVLLTLTSLMLLGASSQAFACACCGLDDTWYEHEFSFEEYQYLELEKLQFTEGDFSDAGYEKLYEIVDVRFDKQKLELVGPMFKAVLQLEDEGSHSRQDITFVVRPESPLTDEAAIFHELVFEGDITLQVAGSPETEHEAKLIMQGVGNACLSQDSLAKWMIKIEDNDLGASGKLIFVNAEVGSAVSEPAIKE